MEGESMSEWKEVRLGNYIKDIAAGPFGSNLKVSCFVGKGFPIIDGANLKSFSLVNIGSSTRPCILYTMSITLEDIQNHFGVDSIYDIPDQLKDELMEKKIYSIYIKTREDIKIKL